MICSINARGQQPSSTEIQWLSGRSVGLLLVPTANGSFPITGPDSSIIGAARILPGGASGMQRIGPVPKVQGPRRAL